MKRHSRYGPKNGTDQKWYGPKNGTDQNCFAQSLFNLEKKNYEDRAELDSGEFHSSLY